MKALLFSLLIVVGLDEAFDGGAGVQACYVLIVDLVRGTRREVGGSVFRR
ncbi:hypothetical protein [Sphingomonas bacterium]|nr:hypothetical protein [Sphingomonas bacterium]